ncbi:MAG: Leucyl/phenylalanyl-tRNA--protein transferase, partial [uncultured Sphingosinicella sp.]
GASGSGPVASRLFDRRLPDVRQPRREGCLLGRAQAPGDPAAGRLPHVALAKEDDPHRRVRRHLRRCIRGGAPLLRQARRDVDQRADRSQLQPPPPARPRPLDRMLAGRRIGGRALWREAWRRILWREHVLVQHRCFKGGACLARRAADGGRLLAARLPVHDRSPAKPRRGRDPAEGLCGDAVRGARRVIGSRSGRARIRRLGPAVGLGPGRCRGSGMRHRAALGPDVV